MISEAVLMKQVLKIIYNVYFISAISFVNTLKRNYKLTIIQRSDPFLVLKWQGQLGQYSD